MIKYMKQLYTIILYCPECEERYEIKVNEEKKVWQERRCNNCQSILSIVKFNKQKRLLE